MLGLAKRVKCRILQASTSEVYGDPAVHPQPESYWGNVNPIGPRACYDEGKRCAETLFFDYHRQHGVDIRVARIFNTYGPRMHPNDGRVVSNFIVQALRGEPITIYGDGSQTRSFCYVDDLIEGFMRLMAEPDGLHRAGQPRQPRRVHDPGAGRAGARADRAPSRSSSTCRCRRTIRSSASPTSRWPGAPRLGAAVALREGLLDTIAYFDRLLSRRRAGRQRRPRPAKPRRMPAANGAARCGRAGIGGRSAHGDAQGF